jgi:HlyD family secretion protein
MTRTFKIAVGVLLVSIVLVSLFVWLRQQPDPQRAAAHEASTSKSSPTLAAFGRVEGRGETISLGASVDGVVKEVFVTDGQIVSKGALLASLDCDDLRSEIELSKAQAEDARQQCVRLLRGHRDEEKRSAAQQTEAAKAELDQAQEHFGRVGDLQKGEISRDALQQAKRDLDVAQANYRKAVEDQSLTDAGPLPEEVSRADADVAVAEQSINVATNKLEKCKVRAPIAGTILKVITKTGEPYSTFLPHPLFTIADESVRRVRAEVDERDVNRVKLGQFVDVSADGFPGEQFKGQVIQISRSMKAKSVLSEDPSQKVDRDVLEVLIELESVKEDLPLGLRVTAQMLGESSPPPSDPQGMSTNRPAAPASRLESRPSARADAATAATGIVLQVAAMTQRENADSLTATLRKANFPAFVLTKKGDPFYRVEVGPFSDVAQSRAAANELKARGFPVAIEHQFPLSGARLDSAEPAVPAQ